MSPLPLIEAEGSPRQVGRAHGAGVRDRIAANLEVYFHRFDREWGVPREEALRRARRYGDGLRDTDPGYWDALEGVAEGSGLALDDLLALNLRYEIVYSEYSRKGQAEAGRRPSGGCTAAGLLPEATRDGRLLMGQNWDWIPGIQGAVLRYRIEGGPAVLAFTEAGIVGPKIGLNEAGIGLLINGLISDRDDWERMGIPFHVRCWRILGARSLEEAAGHVRDVKVSCSANFLLGQDRDGEASLVDLESSPVGVCEAHPEAGRLTHANHFQRPEDLDLWQPLLEERTSTFERQARIDALLGDLRARGEKVDRETLAAILRDHHDAPKSLCRHPEAELPEAQRYQTVVSVLLEPAAGRLWVADGPPCESPYEAHGLAE